MLEARIIVLAAAFTEVIWHPSFLKKLEWNNNFTMLVVSDN
jgi:hypothetical protein